MTTTRSKKQPFEKIDRYVVYTVEGTGAFPIDMLRYDMAWPAKETESHKIDNSFPLTDADEHTVGPIDLPRRPVHQVIVKGIKWPTEARWRSMGWSVVKIEEVR